MKILLLINDNIFQFYNIMSKNGNTVNLLIFIIYNYWRCICTYILILLICFVLLQSVDRKF